MAALQSRAGDEHHHRARSDVVGSPRNRTGFLPFDDILRRVQCAVDPAAPLFTAVAHWQLEIERFPIGVQNQMETQPLFAKFRSERKDGRDDEFLTPAVPQPVPFAEYRPASLLRRGRACLGRNFRKLAALGITAVLVLQLVLLDLVAGKLGLLPTSYTPPAREGRGEGSSAEPSPTPP